MKKNVLFLGLLIMALAIQAQDWSGIPIPATPPTGKIWELNDISDEFNYESTGSNRPKEFTDRWKDAYINGFSGPSATSYHKDHAWTSGGYLNIHANWDANMPIIYTGCISSKTAMTYPMFMQAKVKLAECMLANNVWMISADEKEELDMMETYPNSQEGNKWLDQRLHLSSHTFIREPFTDYQPRDEEEVYGTWYFEKDRETWRDDWITVGMYWRDPHHVEYFVNGEWVRTIEKNYHSFKDSLGNLSEHTTSFDALDKFGYTGGTGMSKPQHIIINMEQQSWLSEKNIYPTKDELKDENGKNIYLVDWIRVYDAVPVGGSVPVTGISVSPIQLNLNAGETATITHTISPSNATNKIVSWTTSNSTIATVNGAGVVTAIGQGTCTAEVTTIDGSFKGVATVTVTGSGTGNVNVSGVSLSPTTASIAIGSTHQFTGTVLPANATNKSVIYSSNNSNIATVNSNGLVTGVSAGSTTITVTTNEGAKTATASVTVTGSSTTVPVTGVSVSPTSKTISVGTTQQLTATVAPSNATNKAVSWVSNNISVATVNNSGLVTAVAAGSATITVTTANGNKTATSAFTVINSGNGGNNDLIIEAENFTDTDGTYNDGLVPNGVNNAGTNINYVNSGDWAEYSVDIAEAGEYEIAYQISSPSDNAQIKIAFDGTVVSTDNVVNNGNWDTYQALTAANHANLSAGSYTMRITASGTNVWQWNLDKITFSKVGGNNSISVTGISVSPATFSLTTVGQSQSIVATVAPSNATNQNVTWSSNNTGVATVNSLGVVTSVANGSASITATTADGNHTATADVTVSVSNPSGIITTEAESYTATDGTYNDAASGGPGLGVNKLSTAINYVNNGDYVEYNVNVPEAGSYEIVYYISSPINNSTISFSADATVLNTTTVPNNGQWENYQALKVAETVNLTSGNNKIQLTAGAQTWTWNLDKFTIQRVGAMKSSEGVLSIDINSLTEELQVYPNPANDIISLQVLSVKNTLVTIEIINSTGMQVLTEKVPSGEVYELNISDLPSGMYFVKSEQSKMKKLIIE